MAQRTSTAKRSENLSERCSRDERSDSTVAARAHTRQSAYLPVCRCSVGADAQAGYAGRGAAVRALGLPQRVGGCGGSEGVE
eukprot:6839777-Prymnesium_polylepis.1